MEQTLLAKNMEQELIAKNQISDQSTFDETQQTIKEVSIVKDKQIDLLSSMLAQKEIDIKKKAVM